MKITTRQFAFALLLIIATASVWAEDDDNWDGRFATNGLNGPVWAIAVSGNNVFVGGQFTQAGPVSANNIARWDGTNWSALGSGIGGGLVTAITIHNGRVYAGGSFTSAGGAPANNIAYWESGSWNFMQGGVDGWVRLLLVGPDNLIYAGGDFTHAGLGFTKPVSFVARWLGEDWDTFGGNFGGVTSLAFGQDALYAVGGGRYQRKYSAIPWADVETGTPRGVVVGDGFFVYEFDERIQRHQGYSITRTTLGTPAGHVWTLLPASADVIYVGGSFTSIDGVPTANIAVRGTNGWSALGSGVGGTNLAPAVRAIAKGGDHVYVGGNFLAAGGKPSPYFAVWRPVPTSPTTSRSDCVPAPVGMVGWWSADGNANDIQGVNHGTAQGGLAFGAGKVGSGFILNTLGNYVRIPHQASLDFSSSSKFTVAVWVLPQPDGRFQAIAVKAPTSDAWNWGLYLGADGRFMAGNQNGEAVHSTNAAQSGVWQHVAFTYDQGTWTLYRNGVAENSNTGPLVTQSGGALAVGRKGDSALNTDYLLGAVDELQMFNRVLTAEEVRAVYAAGGDGLCKRPEFVGIVRENDGSMRVRVKGQTGHDLTLSSSTNLTNWVSWPSVPYTGGTNDIPDSATVGTPKKFYKVTSP
jgi:hypothetical protein